MTRPSFALRRFLHDKLVDRLTEEKVVDKRTIDDLANKWNTAERELNVARRRVDQLETLIDDAHDNWDPLYSSYAFEWNRRYSDYWASARPEAKP